MQLNQVIHKKWLGGTQKVLDFWFFLMINFFLRENDDLWMIFDFNDQEFEMRFDYSFSSSKEIDQIDHLIDLSCQSFVQIAYWIWWAVVADQFSCNFIFVNCYKHCSRRSGTVGMFIYTIAWTNGWRVSNLKIWKKKFLWKFKKQKSWYLLLFAAG